MLTELFAALLRKTLVNSVYTLQLYTKTPHTMYICTKNLQLNFYYSIPYTITLNEKRARANWNARVYKSINRINQIRRRIFTRRIYRINWSTCIYSAAYIYTLFFLALCTGAAASAFANGEIKVSFGRSYSLSLSYVYVYVIHRTTCGEKTGEKPHMCDS